MSTSSVPIRPRRRRAGRAILLGIPAALAALVALVWILPGTLDWNRYRASIAGLLAAGIGRPVQIDGNITLHLLPQPFLTATDLKLDDAGDGVTMQAHAVRLRVALGPLIAGRVDARELTIQGADLRLPWPPPAGALARRPPTWITGLQARVEDSRLQIGGLVLGGIDAALGADPDTGTLSAAGSATLFNLPTRFTVRLGRPGRDGAAPLNVSLDGQDRLRDTGGTVSGTVEADGSLTGRVAARGPDLSQLLPAPATPWRAEGRIAAGGGVLVADELAMEINGSPSRGAVALRVQPTLHLDLSLAASRLDGDAWVQALLRSAPALLRAPQSGQSPILETGIDLSAEQANLAGGTLRQLRTALDVNADGLVVREATALVPGDGRLTLHGTVPRKGKLVSFDGDGALVAPDWNGTLRWLEPVAPAVIRALPPNAFRTADLAARILVDPAQISLTDLKGTLDGGLLQGGVAIRLAARPTVSFGLTFDRLQLDPFLPSRSLLADPAAAYANTIKALAAAGFDSDIKLQVQRAEWRGARFGPLSLDVGTEAGHLTLRRLEATGAGVHAALSGTLGEGGRISEGRVEATAQDIAPLRPFLPAGAPMSASVAALVGGPANLLLTAAGPPEALALRGSLDLGDLRAEAQPVLDLPGHRWAGTMALHHPSASRLLGQLGHPGTNAWLGDGSFSLIAHLAETPNRLDIDNVELVAGELRAAGQVAVAGRAVTGRLRAETLPLPPLDLRSPDPLPLSFLSGLDIALHAEAERVLVGQTSAVTDLATELTVRNGALALDDLRARRDGATLAASLRLEPGDLPRVTLNGRIDDLALAGPLLGGPLDIRSGMLNGKLSVVGEGFSPAALSATLDGSAELTVTSAEVVGFDLSAVSAALAGADAAKLIPALRAAMLGGSSPFALVTVPAKLHRGVATVKATATAPAATPATTPSASLTGTVDLVGRTVEGRLLLSPGADWPELPLRLSGPVTNPTRTPELAGAARWLAERP